MIKSYIKSAKKHTLNLYMILLASFLLTFMTACTIPNHTEADAKRQEELGRPIIEEYLESIADSYEIQRLEMVEARPEGYPMYASSYESDYVFANVTANEKHFYVYANTSTGEVWSGYYSDLIDDILKKQLEPICEKYDITSEFTAKVDEFYYDKLFEGPDGQSLEVTLESCLPSDITPETIEKNRNSISEEIRISCFSIYYAFDDEDFYIPEIADEYYLNYQPISYGNFMAACTMNNTNDDRYCHGTLTAMVSGEDDTDYSEIFWAYKYGDLAQKQYYIVYNSEE